MSDQQRTGLNDAMQVGASKILNRNTASAAGALAGGPVGAASAVLASKRTRKVGAALLSIPILSAFFILMLPGLVFGSLTDNSGALNDNSKLQQNLQDANQAIVEVLQECHDAVLAEVNAAIASLPEGDTAVITDPYAYGIATNANQLIPSFVPLRMTMKTSIFPV